MSKNYVISNSPHIFSALSTKKIMYQVVLALLPAVIASVYFFKLRALFLIGVTVASCLLTETLFQRLRRKEVTITDGSALVTGILFSLVLPPSLPLWMAALGACVAMIFGKHLFGGLGNNIFNPALVGRAFLLIAFPTFMTSWIKPFSLDAVTTATPLGLMKFEQIHTPVSSLFLGNVSGSLGETSALCIIIGGIYLVLRKCMCWRIPVGYLGTVVILGWLFNRFNPGMFPSVGFHLFSGGLMLGAVFMATDPVTSPVSKLGRWIFGIGCGIILAIIRLFGGMPEGVTFSILIMNAATPLINMFVRPKRFGLGR
jgi:electron transport complex protein RnfD